MGWAQADCAANYSTKFGDRSDGRITGVKAGEVCTIPVSVRSPGGVRVTGATLTDIEIVRQPKTGSVRKSGASIVYTPGAGFTGKDSFFVKFVFANAQGERRTSGVRFAVRN
ncbi:MAG: hypothetical protein CTY25_12440 [Methylobacterium sp.]|nr:MAG: hypothetical protein CTY25_12440 [Methylobacterium sp.]